MTFVETTKVYQNDKSYGRSLVTWYLSQSYSYLQYMYFQQL